MTRTRTRWPPQQLPARSSNRPVVLAEDLAMYADDYCLLAMESFVGQTYDQSDFEYAGIVPSRAAWQEGDRAVVCALWRYDNEPTIGSARVEA